MIPLDHFSEEPGCRAGLSKKARNKHEELNRKLYISKDGYIEAFLVNETSENVWFDQFRIETTTPIILQETHYDPWGVELQGLGYQEPGSKVNKYLYNGKEFNDHQGLNLFDYGARLYDAAVGRWFTVDPLAELPSQIAHSPYIYAWNNPVGMIDPTGMAAEESDPGKKKKKDDETPPPGFVGMEAGGGVTVRAPYEPFDFSAIHWGNQKAQMGWEDEKKANASISGNASGVDDNSWLRYLPVVGSTIDAYDACYRGDYWTAAFHAGMAVSDVFLVKSLAVAGGKFLVRNGFKAAGSHSWAATKAYWSKAGIDGLTGGSKHHWAISQRLMEKYPALLAIGNQPWNIIKFSSHGSHMRLAHGQTFGGTRGANLLGQMWFGTPGWFKIGISSGGLYGTKNLNR